jgi:MFS family permease
VIRKDAPITPDGAAGTGAMTGKSDGAFLVWAIVASQFAPPFMFSGVAVALPALGADLGAGAISLGLVETLFLAGSLAFLLPVGRLADASDKRTLFKLGLLSFSVTSILISTLSSMPAILCMRFLQGVTAAIVGATGPAILADVVPPERRGRAYGRLIGAVYAGLTLGPICAGLLIDAWGWRAVFLAGAALIFLGYLLIAFMLRSRWRRPVQPVSVLSTVLVVAAVLCLVAGSATVRAGPTGYALLAVGLALAAAFVRLQRRLSRPLLDVGALMRNRVLRRALLVQMLLYTCAFSSIFMLSIYMQVSLGHPARLAGQVLAVGSVLMTLTSPVAGYLADRVSPRVISSLGVFLVLASTVIAATLAEASSLAAVTVVLAVQGLGFALFSSPNMTMIMNSVSAEATSMASALAAKSRSLGMVTGMLITTVLISLGVGNDPIDRHPNRFIAIMGNAFIILAVVSASALVVSVKARARR